jgi:hypothetical protein
VVSAHLDALIQVSDLRRCAGRVVIVATGRSLIITICD